jgi:hypothetical protein
MHVIFYTFLRKYATKYGWYVAILCAMGFTKFATQNLHGQSAIQGYLRETSDENFVICNPKYKKPLELDILFNSK